MLNRKIVLIGPMGAGKTSLGKRLAHHLHWRFMDTDHEIIKQTGVDIPTIFSHEGEEGFRRREHNVLLSVLAEQHDMVIACGGGIILDSRNRELIAQQQLVIFLDVSVHVQIERIKKDKNRPLAHADDRKKHLTEMRAARLPLYRQLANVYQNTDKGNFQFIFHSLILKVERALKECQAE